MQLLTKEESPSQHCQIKRDSSAINLLTSRPPLSLVRSNDITSCVLFIYDGCNIDIQWSLPCARYTGRTPFSRPPILFRVLLPLYLVANLG